MSPVFPIWVSPETEISGIVGVKNFVPLSVWISEFAS